MSIEIPRIPSHILLGIKDLKADEVTSFIVDRTVHSALRSFSVACKDGLFHEFPDDFALVHLAALYTDGSIETFEKPIQLATARDFVPVAPVSKE